MKARVGRDGPTELFRALQAQSDLSHRGTVKGSTIGAHMRPFVHVALVLLSLLLALELLEAEGHQNISACEDNRQQLWTTS